MVSVRQSKDEAIQHLIEEVEAQAVRKPVLIFLSNDDPEVCQYIESAVGKIVEVKCFKILTEEDATQSRQLSD